MSNVSAWERLPSRPARHAPFPDQLDPALIAGAEALGMAPLYTHQAAAVQAGLDGENLVIVTTTASGKSLGYNLPVLHQLLREPEARALYLFPTKALAQDQAAALADLLAAAAAAETIPVRTYDGDTPPAQRSQIRQEARLLISNPDMLHAGILPHHPRWSEFFENLRWVVLDELHVYRGVFGSNVANLMRRLRRLAAFYGAEPRFALASATISNPRELAEQLIEAPVQLIPPDLDGSPQAEKHVIVYNPPVLDARLGIRRAYTLEATKIAERFLQEEVQTVVFARARRTTEVLLGYIRDSVQANGGDPAAIRGYRGGYLPGERREIEAGLRQGLVRGVVATNALELGVDIGQLGAAVLAGYPGTISSTWQQTGRAGRRSQVSAAVLVASGAPLDQFVAMHPRYLFERPPEMALVNPNNLAILERHLRCAAFELPFQSGDSFGNAGKVEALLQLMAEEGVLFRGDDSYRWVADDYPAEAVSLRASSDDPIVIQSQDGSRPVVIGEVDRAAAPLLVHAGAVYTHEGRTYLVEALDWEAAVASVRPQEVDYYTEAGESINLQILEAFDADERAVARKAHGWAEMTATTTSFRKVKRYSHETLGYGQIDLPDRTFETSAYWLWIDDATTARLMDEGVLMAPVDYGPSWGSAREAARARDGHRCRQCGAPARPDRAHDVHHIRPFRQFGYIPGENRNDRLANELDNLMSLCPSCHQRVESARGARSALAGASYALNNVAPLFLMCDPRDIGSAVEMRSRSTQAPTITLYDRIPEGLGLAPRMYELHDELLRGALELVIGCGCLDGCPACVGPVGPDGGQVKTLSAQLLRALAPPQNRQDPTPLDEGEPTE